MIELRLRNSTSSANLQDARRLYFDAKSLLAKRPGHSPATAGMLHYNTLPRTPALEEILRALDPFEEEFRA